MVTYDDQPYNNNVIILWSITIAVGRWASMYNNMHYGTHRMEITVNVYTLIYIYGNNVDDS